MVPKALCLHAGIRLFFFKFPLKPGLNKKLASLPRMKKKINIITLGCSKNLFDSEQLAAQLAQQYRVEHESRDAAPYVVINTCGFIHDAKEESINTILEYVEAKKQGQVEKVVVTGCLSQRYMDELKKEIPEVDAWFGNHHLKEETAFFGLPFRNELLLDRKTATPPHYAYLKISEGCDRSCSFCAIPAIRGRHVSRPMEEIITEAGRLAAKGVKEIILIAQDLTYYGLDIYGKRRLSDLLKQLTKVDGIQWIRLHYMYPTGFPEEVIDIMAEEPKIVNYLDMPLQHIDSEILASMRRGISGEKTKALLQRIRRKLPDAALRTTFIVGYPGETEEKFRKLLDFVSEMQFDRVGAFTYSHEENTAAYALEDNVPEEVKQERLQRLMDLQYDISLRKNQEKIGRRMKVLIDRYDGEKYLGRTQYDSPEVDNEVIICTDKILTPGKFIEAEITGADAYDLWAKPVDE